MKLIRRGTFETNSSSTHSLTMCMKEDFDNWVRGAIYFIPTNNTFVDEKGKEKRLREVWLNNQIERDYKKKTLSYKGLILDYENWKDRDEKIKQFFTKENLEEATKEELENIYEDLGDWDSLPLTYEQYNDYVCGEYEVFDQEMKTKNGDEVVAFGYYGENY